MAYSFVEYTGDGSTTNYTFSFSYIKKDHVVVYVDGSSVSFTWVSDGEVSLDTAPADGSTVRIKRETPRDNRFVDFSAGSMLTEEDLDLATIQQFYISQEALDKLIDTMSQNDAGAWDASGRRIANIAEAMNATDAMTKDHYDNTLKPEMQTYRDEAYDWAEAAEDTAVDDQAGHSGYSSYHHSQKSAESASAASTSESNAADSENNAQTYRDEAYNWAEAAEDTEVSDEVGNSGYSAYHWAQKTEQAAVALIAAKAPAHYERDRPWKVKGNGTTANRRTLVSPDYLTVNINRSGYILETAVEMDVGNSANWDTEPSSRAGKDFYVYACEPSSGDVPDFILSQNSTVPNSMPSGETPTEDNTRKIAGFHCLCADIGTSCYAYDNSRDDVAVLDDFLVNHDITTSTTKHWLQDFVSGDVIPFSVWDLLHRPQGRPEGFVFDPGSGMWSSIYLPSWDGTLLQSAYNATVADGGNGWHQYRFSQQAHRQACQLAEQGEFVSLSLGSPQGVNIDGGSDPGTTGGHSATDGNRIVSLIGVEDACGVYWQWGREGGATNDVGSSWASAFDSNDLNVGGEHYEAPNRPRFGGYWNDGSKCGSRGSMWNYSALDLNSSGGCRLVSPSVALRSR